jgi:hypothetical protein
LDGNEIFKNLNNKKRYEIFYENDIYWGVYEYNEKIPENFDKNFKMLFYMKDVRGVHNGSEEYLVNIDNLIKKFDNFKLIVRNNFLNELKHSKYQNLINLKYQHDILKLHVGLILKKI